MWLVGVYARVLEIKLVSGEGLRSAPRHNPSLVQHALFSHVCLLAREIWLADVSF